MFAQKTISLVFVVTYLVKKCITKKKEIHVFVLQKHNICKQTHTKNGKRKLILRTRKQANKQKYYICEFLVPNDNIGTCNLIGLISVWPGTETSLFHDLNSNSPRDS